MKKYPKKERLRIIKAIIQEVEVRDQVQLLTELEKLGIQTTQTTISRDLQEIDIVKIRTENGYKYETIDPPTKDKLTDHLKILFDNFVKDIKSTNNLLIIKTSSGNANSVAIVLDRMDMPSILGTIAGDDTILIILDTPESRQTLEEELQAYL